MKKFISEITAAYVTLAPSGYTTWKEDLNTILVNHETQGYSPTRIIGKLYSALQSHIDHLRKNLGTLQNLQLQSTYHYKFD